MNRMGQKLLNWRARVLGEEGDPRIGRCFINLITHVVSLDLYVDTRDVGSQAKK